MTFEFDELRVQPFLGLQYMYLDQRGYSESGAGILDQTTGHQIVSSVRNGFGARVYHETTWRNVLVIPTASARYQHEWGNGTPVITSSLAGAPLTPFAIKGNHTGRDFGLLSAGATAYLTEQFSVYSMLDAQFASSYFAVIGSAGFQYSW
jgi:outer membrane autotransporter protein